MRTAETDKVSTKSIPAFKLFDTDQYYFLKVAIQDEAISSLVRLETLNVPICRAVLGAYTTQAK